MRKDPLYSARKAENQTSLGVKKKILVKRRDWRRTRCEVCSRCFEPKEPRVKEGNKWYHIDCYKSFAKKFSA